MSEQPAPYNGGATDDDWSGYEGCFQSSERLGMSISRRHFPARWSVIRNDIDCIAGYTPRGEVAVATSEENAKRLAELFRAFLNSDEVRPLLWERRL